MLNLDREITPEDFAPDPERAYWDPKERERVCQEREELERLYHLQEEAKAKARWKREQARKDQIPFSEPLATEICERISAGEFLINICLDSDMPTVRSVNRWRKERAGFRALDDEAVSDRLNIFEDQIVTIADESESDFKTITKNGKSKKVLDAEVISRAKLRVDVRKAHLKAYRPERWAEQSTLNVNNNDSFNPDNMTQEQIEEALAELETKDSIVKEPSQRAA